MFDPGTDPSVHTTRARPDPSVTAADADSIPPPPVTVNVTVMPATPTPFASVTVTTRGNARAFPARPVWLSPDVTATAAGGPAPGVPAGGDPPPPPLPHEA